MKNNITIPDWLNREEISVYYRLPRAFLDLWLSPERASEFKAKVSAIPQMPHLKTPSLLFHGPSVKAWLLTYFQK